VGVLFSSIGRKYLMGIAGLVWTGFVLGHMLGNLTLFISAEAYNRYGHAIVTNKPLLYATEGALIGSILIHVIIGVWLTLQNKKANSGKYKVGGSAKKKASTASKTMIWQGSLLLAFIIYHIITFKLGTEYLINYDGVEMRDLHRLIVEVFQDPLYVFGYVFCLLLLGLHLSHGLGSAFQSVGFNHPRYTPLIKKASIAYGFVVALGFIAQPLYVYFIYEG